MSIDETQPELYPPIDAALADADFDYRTAPEPEWVAVWDDRNTVGEPE